MSDYAKILSLAYNSAVATKASALKSHYRSVRLVKDVSTINPGQNSTVTNVLLNGKCLDPENRNLYVFYIDTYYGSAWIIEINLDTRRQEVVYFDRYNAIGFDPLYKIHNARVVHGQLVWTDNKNPIYKMDILRAKKSFKLGIGYGDNAVMGEWIATEPYLTGKIVSNANRFYQALSNNTGTEPKTDNGTVWMDLCLIEDAYYSMNIENFYFEAMPPKTPPVVTYYSDAGRRINNLKNALFQFAYRYVYMDWRKSTFSPASVVPIPQQEEQVTTGLSNGDVSLNNKLQISVNTGGEEVREIEIIARSSEDPSKWFLIDTIKKFEAQERGSEISRTTEPAQVEMAMSVPDPTIVSENTSVADVNNMLMTPMEPTVYNTYVSSLPAIAFLYSEYGYADREDITIDCAPEVLTLISKSSWITLRRGGVSGYDLSAGMNVLDGDVIAIYPTAENGAYSQLDGTILFRNSFGDYTTITISQSAHPLPTPEPVTCTVQKDPDDTSPMTITNGNASAMSLSNLITISFRVDNPDYGDGVAFTMSWRADIGVLPYGNGSFTVLNNRTNNPSSLALNRNLAAGETVSVYLATEDINFTAMDKINMGMAVQDPSVINSSVAASANHLIWLAAEYGPDDKEDLLMEAKPYNAYLSAKPDWITIRRNGYEMSVGMYFNDGDTLEVYPTVENTGGAKTAAPITFATIYGDSYTVYVEQAAAVVIPPSEVTCYVSIDPDEPGDLRIYSGAGVVNSGETVVRITGSVTYNSGLSDPFILWWKITINGVTRGHNAISGVYNGAIDYYLAADIAMLAGDTVRVYLSTVEIT